MENNYQEMLELTCKLANINSGSYNTNGLNKIADLLFEEFSNIVDLNNNKINYDLKQKIDIPDFEIIDLNAKKTAFPLGPILHFKKNNNAKNSVLLVGHMDTVFELSNPFQKVINLDPDRKKINGPGVTDMKGGIVVMLYALKEFMQSKKSDKLNIEIILNSDEELGSPGSAEYIKTHAKNNNFGLLFEPALDLDGNLAGNRKGSACYTIVARGKAAHAGRDFNKGHNAIVKMAQVIKEIHNLNKDQNNVTFNIGIISGGNAINVIPDLSVCKIGVRTLNLIDQDWVEEKIQSIVKKNQSEVRLELHGGFTKKPKILDKKTIQLYELVKKSAKELGQDLNWFPTGGCCDGNNLSEVGLPNVDTLGVIGGDIHSPLEFLITESLVTRSQLTSKVLLKLADGL